jgi:GMP synthase-like glutamine amidotransferase
MKTICVIQHTEAEYLGLMEDHFEGRNIRFLYQRPFAAGGKIPADTEGFDGLILLGGGPYGIVSGHLLPSLAPELRLTKGFLDAELPVVGIELGALILAVSAGGGADEAPLRFDVTTARETRSGILGGHMPEQFPLACYLRDRPVLPGDTDILATSPDGDPLVFSLRGNCLGFMGHPGMKRGMAEDLIMEFAETPDHTVEALEALGEVQGEVAAALTELMVGTIAHTGWM